MRQVETVPHLPALEVETILHPDPSIAFVKYDSEGRELAVRPALT